MNKALVIGSVAVGICAVSLILVGLATDRLLSQVPGPSTGSKPGKEKVIGAFGFTLGQRAPVGVRLKTQKDGSRLFEFKANAPFDEGYCWVNRDGLIHEIEAVPGIIAEDELYALKKVTFTGLEQ